MSVRIGLTGDVMLGRLVDETHKQTKKTAVWGSLCPTLRNLDGLFINLECCLSTGGEPWQQTDRPFHFRADPSWAIPALTSIDVSACALANNHILDFGEDALRDTVNHLETNGVSYAGAGLTRNDAFEPTRVTINGTTITFVSFTDNTPEYAASQTTPGTAHIEIDRDNPDTRTAVKNSLDEVKAHEPDVLITSLHWGPNMVETPLDSFQQFARWLIDQGTDIVHGHSAHIFQGIEVYQNSPILYDTGDFVDDYAVDPDLHNDRSFLFVLGFSDTGAISTLRLIPTEIRNCVVHKASESAAEWSRERMRKLSQPFGTTFSEDDTHLLLPLDNDTE